MINHDYDTSLQSSKSLLKNDVIRLKDHQIKSSKKKSKSLYIINNYDLFFLVNWMLKREQDLSSTTIYTPLYHCHDLSDNLFYVHVINGIPLHINEINNWKSEEFSLSGGILCDEMGLGKTMCVLLTSLLNKCPNSFLSNNFLDQNEEFSINKKFKSDEQLILPCICGKIAKISKRNAHLSSNFISICSQCSRSIHKKCLIQNETTQQTFLCPYCEQNLTNNNELLSTSATLIIAPASIINQWIEEINKHLNCSLNIYMYESIVNKIPIPNRDFLAKQDFIFCSYENLKKDIHHNEICSKEYHSTRTQIRKYEYLISPLLRLKFWRLG
jgi:SNF2 family DNA or RNA helicase